MITAALIQEDFSLIVRRSIYQDFFRGPSREKPTHLSAWDFSDRRLLTLLLIPQDAKVILGERYSLSTTARITGSVIEDPASASPPFRELVRERWDKTARMILVQKMVRCDTEPVPSIENGNAARLRNLQQSVERAIGYEAPVVA